MRRSLSLNIKLDQAIDDEIAQRTTDHQMAMNRVRSSLAIMAAAGAAPVSTPLAMLAVGDSWFDYPLSGNSFSVFSPSTDIIAQLSSMGTLSPMILNLSHFGDATRDELGLPKQQRMFNALNDPRNWGGSGRPDAILFSGGGNDVAGNPFCIYLDYNVPGATGLNAARFQDALDGIRASYLDLIAFRDRFAAGVPIFAHCYDFPIPNGVHPSCAGPWLQPSLQFCGWNAPQGLGIMRQALTDFRTMLVGLAVPANNLFLVDTQGTLTASDWANELHPFPSGFQRLANVFVSALRGQFPGRI